MSVPDPWEYLGNVPKPYCPTSSTQSPFIINDPNSVKADEVGLSEGKLMLNNLDVVTKLKALKEKLEKNDLKGAQVDITHFKNWGATQESTLLYAKPTSRSQVQALVRAAAKENVKVTIVVYSLSIYACTYTCTLLCTLFGLV